MENPFNLSMSSDQMYCFITRRRRETTQGECISSAGWKKKYLTAARQVNSELLAKTFNRSLVSPECRQQKSIAALCEAYHRLLRSSHQATNESHNADRSRSAQRAAVMCV